MLGFARAKTIEHQGQQQVAGRSPATSHQSSPYAGLLALQRMSGNWAVEQLLQSSAARQQRGANGFPSNVHSALDSGSGQPLEPGVRGFMENQFRQDFSSVRVHKNEHAAQATQQLDAAAYTVGRDIFFGGARYRPETQEGKRLLAHELAHVAQQTGGSPSFAAVSDSMPMSVPGDVVERKVWT